MEGGLTGRILKKLIRSIPQVGGYLTHSSPDPLLHPRPPHDEYGHLSPPPSTSSHHQPAAAPTPDPGRAVRQLPLISRRVLVHDDCRDHPGDQDQHQHQCCRRRHPPPAEPFDIIYVDELMRHSNDGEADDLCSGDDKENARPTPTPSTAAKSTAPSLRDGSQRTRPFLPEEHGSRPPASPEKLDVSTSCYRRPDPNACSLFDPELLVAFQQAVMEYTRACEELCRKVKSAPKEGEQEEEEEEQQEQDKAGDLHRNEEEEPPCKVPRTDIGNGDDNDGGEQVEPLRGFELRCPPAGGGAVVLYTTSLRGIRKTFEDCSSVRFLLCSLRVMFYERDVSMHLGYREELWHILGGRAIPPRLFIRGRYIGGADEVLGLHEQGRLLPLMRGMPAVDRTAGGEPCRWCGGARFVLCAECSGSRKVYEGGGDGAVRCPHCNENGLVVCRQCC